MMMIKRPILIATAALALGLLPLCGQSQAVTLNEGESYSLSFSSLPEINLQGGNNHSFVRANLFGNLLDPGEIVEVKLYESDLDGTPVHSATITPPPSAIASIDMDVVSASFWRDYQGAVAFTVLKGSITISEIQIRVDEGGQLHQGNYDVRISEAPIPGALPLFASALGLGGLFSYRRKRKAVAA